MKYFLLLLFFSLNVFAVDVPYIAPLGTASGNTATGLGPATSETIRIALADGANIQISDGTNAAAVEFGNLDATVTNKYGLFTNSRQYIFDGGWSRARSVGIGNNTQGIGLPATGVWGQLPNGFYSAFSLDSLARLNFRPLTAASDTVTVNGLSDAITSGTSGFKSVLNSRTTAIGSNQTFTGTGEDVLKYQNIQVSVAYNQAVSFTVQWSDDNITWFADGDSYTVPANTLKKNSYGRTNQYFRILVTNLMGTGTQGFTSVIYDYQRPKPSSHRIAENVSIESDAELTKGMIFGLNSSGTATTIFRGTASGSLFVGTADNFSRIKKKEFFDTEEVLYDIPANLPSSFIYTGVAIAGTSSATATWSVIRTSFDSNGNPSRDQFRTGVSWTARASGW
jgi:hypothetical protein